MTVTTVSGAAAAPPAPWSSDWLLLAGRLKPGDRYLVWDTRVDAPRLVTASPGLRLREENGREYGWNSHFYTHWLPVPARPGA